MSEITQKSVVELFGGGLHDKNRLLYPNATDESVESRVITRFRGLRELGNIALVDGAFDVPHNNHEWYLRHCKLIGIFAALQAQYGDNLQYTDVAMRLQSEPTLAKAASLAVTVDADSKVAAKKSGLEHKGGVRRPIYPWNARADRLAGYHFELAGTLHQTVDLVTVEGDPIHRGTPLESSLTLAHFLKQHGLLDTFIVYGEHSSTVDEATELGLQPVVIDDSSVASYETNPQTGKNWSSSSIISRAQGKPVATPITRPEGL